MLEKPEAGLCDAVYPGVQSILLQCCFENVNLFQHD